MIILYDKNHTSFEGNGTCVLTPLSGSIRMVAGGSYELDMVHPIDERGKWLQLVEEAIIKAPVPKETIKATHSGVDCDIYKTTAKTPMRSGTQDPVPVTYNSWSLYTQYYAGAKVRYADRNWQCKQWDGQSYLSTVPPGPNHPWWVMISGEMTPGSPIIVNLKNNQKLFYVSGPTNGWYKLETMAGIQGYVKASDVTFLEHWSASQNPKRTITSQLFRIKTVDIDTNAMEVKVHAVHVSYDLNGVMVKDVNLHRKYGPTALAMIEDGFMTDYAGTISTDLPTSSGKKYTGSFNGKSGMFCLLDPDEGIVPAFRAEFRRDNWDLFVMAKATHDNGYYMTYGNNMTGVQWHKSTENLITRVIPVAKKANGTDLFLSGDGWVDSDNISNYPVIYTEWLKVPGQVDRDDGSETATNWTTSTLRDEMERQAQNRFDVDHCDEPIYEITVEFEMLGNTAEYEYLKKLQTVLLYDKIRVRDTKTGQSATVTVQELEYDIVKEKVIAVKLSNVKKYQVKNVSGYNVANNSISWLKLTSEAVEEINEGMRAWVEDNFKTR